MQSIETTTRDLFVTYFSYTFHIATVSYLYFIIFIIEIYTCVGIFAAIVYWPTEMLLFQSYYILNCLELWLYHKYWICSSVIVYNKIHCSRQRNTLPSIPDNQQKVPKITSCYQTINHWNTEHYRVLDDLRQGYLDSDTNRLASGNIIQYTTLPSQFEQLNLTRTWHFMYIDCWYHFDKQPISVKTITWK